MATPVINLLAVFGAAVVAFIVGMLWYGPLFGKKWMRLSNITEKSMKEMKMSPMTSMGLGFVTALVTAYVLAHFVDYADAVTAIDGATAGFWAWLGFVAMTQVGGVIWENKPTKLFMLNTAHSLIALLLMGAILAVWV